MLTFVGNSMIEKGYVSEPAIDGLVRHSAATIDSAHRYDVKTR